MRVYQTQDGVAFLKKIKDKMEQSSREKLIRKKTKKAKKKEKPK